MIRTPVLPEKLAGQYARRRAYDRAYRQRPHTKEHLRAYVRAYRQRPYVKERLRAYQQARSEHKREYDRARYRKNHPQIRARIRLYELRKKFGLDKAAWQTLLSQQAGCCAICGRKPQATLCVDHDHRTGEVRGLLCRHCNVLVGFFERHHDALLTYLEARRRQKVVHASA